MTEHEKDIGILLRLIETFRRYHNTVYLSMKASNPKHEWNYGYMIECLEKAVDDSLEAEGCNVMQELMFAIMEFTEGKDS